MDEGKPEGEPYEQFRSWEDESEEGVPRYLYSALEACRLSDSSAMVRPIIEKIESSGVELTSEQKEIIEDIDWWVQIIDSGDKKRARDYYEERLKSHHDGLAGRREIADDANR